LVLIVYPHPETQKPLTFSRARHTRDTSSSLQERVPYRHRRAGPESQGPVDDDIIQVADQSRRCNLGDAIRDTLQLTKHKRPHYPDSIHIFMASVTVSANPHPLSDTSYSRQNHLNKALSFSAASGAFEQLDTPSIRHSPNMSFSMSQGSQGNGLMMQTGPFRQYDGNSGLNGLSGRNSAPQIYSVSSSTIIVENYLSNICRPCTQG
jgi:hypothetical protein